MKTFRVKLLSDRLVNRKPIKKGSVITVDEALYNYMDSCACIEDAPPEVKPEPVKPTPAKVQAKK